MPGLVYLIRLFKFIILLYTDNYKKILVITGLIFLKVLNILSALFIYKIAFYFKKNTIYDLPYYSACIFLFNPASIFYNSIYTEPLFTFLVFLGILKAF